MNVRGIKYSMSEGNASLIVNEFVNYFNNAAINVVNDPRPSRRDLIDVM